MLGSNFMNDKRLDSFVFRFCNSVIIVLFTLYLLLGISCQKETWNPDDQYFNEIDRMKKISSFRESEVREKAHKNVLNAKANLYQNLGSDLELNSWLMQNKYRMPLIAKAEHNNISWEKRRGKFSIIMEFYYGGQSEEFNLATENDFEIFFICNLDRITSFERF